MNVDPALVQQGILFYIILASSIALHEWGHAKSADMLGDFLPRSQGRVTLNPLAHLDPIGTGLIPALMIFIPIFGGHLPFAFIGWGKPVQISLIGIKKDRKIADMIITAAGPLMNLVIAVGAMIIGGCLLRLFPSEKLVMFVGKTILLNCALIVFNMIPIPPLDGSHFMRHLVGMKEETYFSLSRYGVFILLILINTPIWKFFIYPIYFLSFPIFIGVGLISGINVGTILGVLFG